MRRAVFLDRDGVINRAPVHGGRPHSPSGVGEFEILPCVPEACERLRHRGFLLIVVTNQPSVARGIQERKTIDEIHAFLRGQILLDDVRVCFHDDADQCYCRKPKPGMLLAAAEDWGIELNRSVMIGDRWRDIEAGRAAGCRTVFINRNYDEPRPARVDFEADSLEGAVDWIIAQDD